MAKEKTIYYAAQASKPGLGKNANELLKEAPNNGQLDYITSKRAQL